MRDEEWRSSYGVLGWWSLLLLVILALLLWLLGGSLDSERTSGDRGQCTTLLLNQKINK